MNTVIKLVGKIVLVKCGETFNFENEEILRRAMLAVKNCYEFDGHYINGMYLITFRGAEDDDVLERRVAEVVGRYERGEL